MARITVTIDSTKLKPLAIGGKPDPLLAPWFEWGKGQKNVITTSENATGKTSMEFDSHEVNMKTLEYAISKGGTVDNAPVAVKMPLSAYNDEVPVGIQNRTHNVDEVEVVRNWSDWRLDNQHHMDAADGGKIIEGDDDDGAVFTCDELKVLLAEPRKYTLYLAHEIGAELEQQSDAVSVTVTV